MIPFLRWAGGKRWLTDKISPLLRSLLGESNGTYYEPFLGSGAIFFSIAPNKSVLSDINKNLINSYTCLKEDWSKVQNKMTKWSVDRGTYYFVRDYKPKNKFECAAQFIWLNRTCYGGLYRENKSGKFNVPFGGGSRSPELLYKNNILERVSQILNNDVKLISSDFQSAVASAKSGDLIYCDPTYTNIKRNQFDRYGASIFSWNDHIRLSKVAYSAFQRGVTIIISNGLYDDLISLYPNAYYIVLNHKKSMGKILAHDNNGYECLFILDPKGRKSFWNKIGDVKTNKFSI